MPKSIRNYMNEIRKKDKLLHNYSSTDTSTPYTTKCGAVDMRQPIIVSNRDLENMKRKNMEGYLKISDSIIQWGSRAKSLNHYICPRVWCIRCKMVITEKQLIEHGGKCLFCDGKIIKDKSNIKKSESIIVRQTKSDYWGGSKDDIPEDVRNDPNWDKYLKGTEKTAYPSFLDSKIHPLNMCTICCNANQVELAPGIHVPKNIGLCFNYEVDNIINNKIKLEDLKIGNKIGDIVLSNRNKILLLNGDPATNNFYMITENGPKVIEKFGENKVGFMNGMVVTNLGSPNHDSYSIYKVGDIIKKKIYTKKGTSTNYILGAEKFPLSNKKYGVLPGKLDKFFNDNSMRFIDKGVMKKGNKTTKNNLILRKGIEHNPKYSFLETIASLKKSNCVDYINVLIDYLTPDIFISLNNGEIFKYFHENTDYSNYHSIFIVWCKEYESNLKNLGYSELNVIVTDGYSNIKDDLEVNVNIRHLYNIYISMENYKKYICDLNIYKDYNLLIDLAVRIMGFNIIIFDETFEKHVKILNPINSDIYNIYKDDNPNVFLYKVGVYYEPLYELEKNNNNFLSPEKFIFENDKHLYKIDNIKNLINKQNRTNNISFHKLLPLIKDHPKFDYEYIIVDKYFKGVGIFTKDQSIIHTAPFSIDFQYPFNYVNKLPRLSIENINEKYSELYKFLKGKIGISLKLEYLVVDKDNVHSIMNNNDNYIPCKGEKYVDKKYKLDKIDEKYVIDDIDEILFNDIMGNDSRIDYNNIHDLKRSLYNNLKYEIAHFFRNEKINLKKHIKFFIENNVIPIDLKREQVNKLIDSIIKNVIVFDTPKIIDNKEQIEKVCHQLNNTNCNKNLKCKLSKSASNKVVKFDEIDYNLDKNECKFILDKDHYDFFSWALSEEILKNHSKRTKILDGTYKLPISKKLSENIIELNGLNYIEKIRELYHQNKYVYVNEYFNNIFYDIEPKKPLTSDNIDNQDQDQDQEYEEVYEEANNNTKPLKTRYAVKFKYNKKSKKRVVSKDPNSMAGQCIFPFKNKKHEDPKIYDCVDGKTPGSSWCATEIKPNLLKEKWGYCLPEGMSLKEYNTQISNHIAGKPIVTRNNSNNRNNSAAAPRNNSNNSVEPVAAVAPRNNSSNSGSAAAAPRNNSGTAALAPRNNGSKLKTRHAVKYTYHPKSKKKVISKPPDSKLMAGQCVFPFKNKKHTDPKIYDCVPGYQGSSWCATNVRENLLKDKWGYCVPEGMTPEEYGTMYAGKN